MAQVKLGVEEGIVVGALLLAQAAFVWYVAHTVAGAVVIPVDDVCRIASECVGLALGQ